jgi:hypothetical protein
MPVCMVPSYRWDAYKRGLVLAMGVTPIILCPLVTGVTKVRGHD